MLLTNSPIRSGGTTLITVRKPLAGIHLCVPKLSGHSSQFAFAIRSSQLVRNPGYAALPSSMAFRELLTAPNIVSAFRVPLAAGFLIADTTPLRLALLGMASATDLLDGWIARRTGSTTRMGALIDPLADKLFVLLALAAFLVRGDLSSRDYAVLLARDIAVGIGALVALAIPGLDPRDFKARMSGKVVTVLQLLALLALCVAWRWMSAIVVVVGVASVVSIADYTLALAVAQKRRR